MKKLLPTQVSAYLKQLPRRFPILMLVSLMSAGISAFAAYDHIDSTVADNMVFTMVAMLSWGLCATLIAERFQLRQRLVLLVQTAAVILLSFMYFLLPADGIMDDDGLLFQRLGVVILAGIVLGMTVAFAKKGEQRLWQYWATTVRAAIVAIITTVAFGAALSLAVVAIDQLFDLSQSIYPFFEVIWRAAWQVLGVWIFLSGVPHPQKKPAYRELSRFIQIFLYYVLLPIVGLYFLIFYTYTAKILFTWQWPEDGVVYWIFGLALVGISAYLVAFGKSERYERITRLFSRSFFILLFPQLVLLFVAIGVRIQAYGLTADRLFVVVGAVWLTAASVYIMWRRAHPLQCMAYSGITLLVLSLFGPWNVYRVSLADQVGRLEQLLEEQQVLVNEKIVSTNEPVTIAEETYSTIQSRVGYIVSHDGLHHIAPWFSQTFDEEQYSYGLRRDVVAALPLESQLKEEVVRTHYYLSSDALAEDRGSQDIRRYDELISSISLFGTDVSKLNSSHVATQRGLVDFVLVGKGDLEIRLQGDVVMRIDLLAFARENARVHGVFNEVPEMIIYQANDALRVRLFFSRIRGDLADKEVVTVNDVKFSALLGW